MSPLSCALPCCLPASARGLPWPSPPRRQCYDAVRKSNAQMEWVAYAEEGHDWVLPQTHVDFWQQSEKFLDKYIGKNSAAAKKE